MPGDNAIVEDIEEGADLELLARKANKAEAERWEYELNEAKTTAERTRQKGKTLSTLCLINMLDSKMIADDSNLTQVKERLSKRGDNIPVAEFQEMLVDSRHSKPAKSSKRVKRPRPIDVDFQPSKQLNEMTRELIQKPAAPERPDREYCGCRSCEAF